MNSIKFKILNSNQSSEYLLPLKKLCKYCDGWYIPTDKSGICTMCKAKMEQKFIKKLGDRYGKEKEDK